MNKKTVISIGIGIIVILLSLSINLIFSENSETTDLILTNIEALAEPETSGGDIKPNCVESGCVCMGIDKNGIIGQHPGLMHQP